MEASAKLVAQATCIRSAMKPAMRSSLDRPFAHGGGVVSPPSTGDLEIDGFSVLVDTFPIIFA